MINLIFVCASKRENQENNLTYFITFALFHLDKSPDFDQVFATDGTQAKSASAQMHTVFLHKYMSRPCIRDSV